MACAVAYKYMCSDPGQSLIRQKIAAERLTGVVVASCSPHMHLRTFRKAAAREGSESRTWSRWPTSASNAPGCITDRQQATAKAIELIRMAVAKVRCNHALPPIEIPGHPPGCW